jgi:hypothetical protein
MDALKQWDDKKSVEENFSKFSDACNYKNKEKNQISKHSQNSLNSPKIAKMKKNIAVSFFHSIFFITKIHLIIC